MFLKAAIEKSLVSVAKLRYFTVTGIEKLPTPSPSLFCFYFCDTMVPPCGCRALLRLRTSTSFSTDFHFKCCSLLQYLEVEVISSQWRVPLLMHPSQTFPSYNNPKPQPACLYHQAGCQAYPQPTVRGKKKEGWDDGSISMFRSHYSPVRFSHLQATLPVIPSTVCTTDQMNRSNG